MPKKKEVVEENVEIVEEEAPVVEEEAPKAAKSAKTSVDVYDQYGTFVRTYSKEVHGESFASLAVQFANKRSYIIK